MTDYLVQDRRSQEFTLVTGDSLTVAAGAVLTSPEVGFAHHIFAFG